MLRRLGAAILTAQFLAVGCSAVADVTVAPGTSAGPGPSRVPAANPEAKVDTARMAQAASVSSNAVHVAGAHGFTSVHRDGSTSLLWIWSTGNGYAVQELARVQESWPPDAAYTSRHVTACQLPGVGRQWFVFGIVTDPLQGILRLEPSVGVGGRGADDTWVFALDRDLPASTSLLVAGGRPQPVAQLTSLSASTPCEAP